MKLLHVDTGITGPQSVTRMLSAAIVEAAQLSYPDLAVTHRDLDAEPIPHLGSTSLSAGEPADLPETRLAATVLDEFLDADIVVIGAPMYNFGIPSQLKAWFDRILVAGKTFRYTEQGPVGLAGGKTVILASARGGLFEPGTARADDDFQEPHLRTMLRFAGIEDVRIVRAEGVAIGPEQRQAAIDTALAAIPSAVHDLALAA